MEKEYDICGKCEKYKPFPSMPIEGNCEELKKPVRSRDRCHLPPSGSNLEEKTEAPKPAFPHQGHPYS